MLGLGVGGQGWTWGWVEVGGGAKPSWKRSQSAASSGVAREEVEDSLEDEIGEGGEGGRIGMRSTLLRWPPSSKGPPLAAFPTPSARTIVSTSGGDAQTVWIGGRSGKALWLA